MLIDSKNHSTRFLLLFGAAALLGCPADPSDTQSGAQQQGGVSATPPQPSAATSGAAATASGTSGAPATAGVPSTPTTTAGVQAPIPAGSAAPTAGKDAPVPPTPALPTVTGLPDGAEKIAGLDLMQRLAGKWSGTNSNTPLGFDFPMIVEFVPSGDGMLFAKYDLGQDNNVLWGFNVETYAGQDVLAYRNGGYLSGVLRDSRTKLVEHDAARGYYRFCAVSERGVAVDGCNYIDASYTFSAPDKMLFEVKTRGTSAHVHWDATRIAKVELPNPFPASIASQGNGSAAWPEAAGIH